MSHGRAIERDGQLRDSGEESINEIAGLTLSKHPGLAEFRGLPFASRAL